MTNDSEENIKEDFYYRRQTDIQAQPRQNIFVTMGDFNTKIGSNSPNLEKAFHLFPAENHGPSFGGADSHCGKS